MVSTWVLEQLHAIEHVHEARLARVGERDGLSQDSGHLVAATGCHVRVDLLGRLENELVFERCKGRWSCHVRLKVDAVKELVGYIFQFERSMEN